MPKLLKLTEKSWEEVHGTQTAPCLGYVQQGRPTRKRKGQKEQEDAEADARVRDIFFHCGSVGLYVG